MEWKPNVPKLHYKHKIYIAKHIYLYKIQKSMPRLCYTHYTQWENKIIQKEKLMNVIVYFIIIEIIKKKILHNAKKK